MKNLDKVGRRRIHRERAQPAARKKLGLLEKHSDYVTRARDYNLKQKRIQTLREKAALRNPDEFYFGMINAKTEGGIHRIDKKSDEEMYAPAVLKKFAIQVIFSTTLLDGITYIN